MTLFAAALKLVGLSHAEAAEFLDARIDTVKSWSADRNRVPLGVWTELRALYAQQVTATESALDLIDEKEPDELALNTSGPRSKEWPSPGAHMATLAAVALSVDIPIAQKD